MAESSNPAPVENTSTPRKQSPLQRLLEFQVDPADLVRPLGGPVAGTLGVSALAFYGATVALHMQADRSAWHTGLPTSFLLGVIAHELSRAAPLCLLVVFLTAAASFGRSVWARYAWTTALATVIGAWLSSWAVFWMTGRFLDGDAVALAMASPGPMLLHGLQFAFWPIVLLPLVSVGLAAGLVALARRSSRLPAWQRGVALAGTVLVAYTAFSMARDADSMLRDSELSMSHPEGGSTSLGDLWASLRDERSGPVAHLRAAISRPSIEEIVSPDIAVRWPDRVEYAAARPAAAHNVIFLVVESLRSDELGAWGSQLDVMPNVDRLAREGAVFLDHQAVATHSNYSAVAPVSSQFPMRHENLHIYPKPLGYPRVMIYEVLKRLGYRASIISSQNERWGGMANFLESDELDHFFHSETFGGETYVMAEDGGFARYTGQFGRAGKIDDRLTIDEAIRWIGDGGGEPFFTYINLQNSHVPYPIPAEAATPFGPRTTSFPIRFNLFPADSALVVRGVYRNALHYVDAQIGRLAGHLRATGQLDRTIFVIMGDHGQAFLEHGFGAHGNALYEELLRTPLIIRGPGIAPSVREGLAQHVDVAPTVLGLLGLPPHPGFQGVDLFQRSRSFAYSIVQTTLANQYGVSDGRRKLVVDARRGSVVLRDLAVDPMERFDFAPRDAATVEALRARLETWRAVQLRYYRNPVLHLSAYPPIVLDTPAQPTHADATP